jgi:proline iminopeptidase
MVRCGILFILSCTLVFKGITQPLNIEGLKRINGTNLYVKIIGKGEPIIVIHGGPGMNQSYFFPHLNTLAKKYKLIFFDQRASGQSAIPSPDSISLDFFVEDIEALRKELKLAKVNLLAHSWGAIPALQYALAYPDQVNKMILSNPVAFSTEYNSELSNIQKRRVTRQDSLDRAQLLASPEFRNGDSEAYKKLLLLSFRHSFFKAANFKKLQYQMPGTYVQASRALFTGLGNDLSEYNYYKEMKECSIPVLIIHGAADAIPLAIQTRAQQSFSKANLLVFKSSGHFAFIEEAERFRKEVTLFLSKK